MVSYSSSNSFTLSDTIQMEVSVCDTFLINKNPFKQRSDSEDTVSRGKLTKCKILSYFHSLCLRLLPSGHILLDLYW